MAKKNIWDQEIFDLLNGESIDMDTNGDETLDVPDQTDIMNSDQEAQSGVIFNDQDDESDESDKHNENDNSDDEPIIFAPIIARSSAVISNSVVPELIVEPIDAPIEIKSVEKQNEVEKLELNRDEKMDKKDDKIPPELYGIGLFVGTTDESLILHALVGLTGCVIRASDKKVMSTFAIEMNIPDDKNWGSFVLRKMWDSNDIKLLEFKNRVSNRKAKDPELAMRKFTKWLRQDVLKIANGDPSVLYFITETCSFDSTWINYYLDLYIDEAPLHIFWGEDHYRDVICSKDFAMGLGRFSLLQSYIVEKVEGKIDYVAEAFRWTTTSRSSDDPKNKNNVGPEQFVASFLSLVEGKI